ncbi:ABC transporter substrate binding protein [uncultured archaeon]|nr:ABC transporter substrate binding protein [uncultured archaeon]
MFPLKQNRFRRQIQLVTLLVAIMFLSGCTSPPTQKVYHVGILSGTDDFLPIADGFKAKMTKLGYVEGKNIVYDLRKTNADPAGEQLAAKKFVDDRVDLIFTFPTEPSITARNATRGTNIPVVFAYAGIEGSNLVKSVREPGGNNTGVRFPGPEQITKRLEILLDVAPSVKRVWIGYDRNYPNNAPTLAALRPLALSRGVTLVEVPAANLEEIRADLEARNSSPDIGMDAIILMPDIFNHCPEGWGMIRKFAAEHRVPVGGSFLYTVEQGAVFGNANDLVKVGELAAPQADKILRGVPAGTIPVVTPEQELWINYKRAQELNLTVSEGLLSRAVEIIR